MSAFASIVTAAAVLRAGGRVFFGWGPAEPEVPGTEPIDDEPATHGPRRIRGR